MPSVYKLIKYRKEYKQLIKYCKQTGWASIDFETTGLEYYDDNHYPTILGVSFQVGSAWIIPLNHFESPPWFKKNYKKVLKDFGKKVIENPNIIKVAWNMKFEQKWFLTVGIRFLGICMDGMLAKHLLDENTSNKLKDCVRANISEFSDYEDEVATLVKKHRGWANVPIAPLSMYCGKDCDLTLRLMLHYEKSLIKAGLYGLFRNLQMMASRVLAESEFGGLRVDREYLVDLDKKYRQELDGLEEKLKTNKYVRRFDKAQRKQQRKKLISDLKDELTELRKDKTRSPGSLTRMINGRQQKITNIVSGDFKGAYDTINFASPKQLIEFFYTHKRGLRFKVIKYTRDKKTKKDTKTPSTDEATLLQLKEKDKSGIIELLLDHRGKSKLYGTYVKGILERLTDGDEVHANFKIHGTVTGRLSCSDPNLQNIPRGTTAADIKTMFIPPKGRVLLEVDYSQAELRVVAEMAQDKAMIDIFDRGYNIHVATACKINGVLDKYEHIHKNILKNPEHKDHLYWEKQKKKAKTLNFGILYGQGPTKLAEGMGHGTTREEAAEFTRSWLAAYPQVKKWIKRQYKIAEKQGYVVNIFGRKRRLPDIYSDNDIKFLEAQRQSVNAPIQGCASDFTQLSSVVIREKKQAGIFEWDMHQAYTVHDSLGFYIKPELIHTYVPKIIEICNNPDTLKYFNFELKHVKMKVSPEIGLNWAGLEDYNPQTDYTTWMIQP